MQRYTDFPCMAWHDEAISLFCTAVFRQSVSLSPCWILHCSLPPAAYVVIILYCNRMLRESVSTSIRFTRLRMNNIMELGILWFLDWSDSCHKVCHITSEITSQPGHGLGFCYLRRGHRCSLQISSEAAPGLYLSHTSYTCSVQLKGHAGNNEFNHESDFLQLCSIPLETWLGLRLALSESLVACHTGKRKIFLLFLLLHRSRRRRILAKKSVGSNLASFSLQKSEATQSWLIAFLNPHQQH